MLNRMNPDKRVSNSESLSSNENELSLEQRRVNMLNAAMFYITMRENRLAQETASELNIAPEVTSAVEEFNAQKRSNDLHVLETNARAAAEKALENVRVLDDGTLIRSPSRLTNVEELGAQTGGLVGYKEAA